MVILSTYIYSELIIPTFFVRGKFTYFFGISVLIITIFPFIVYLERKLIIDVYVVEEFYSVANFITAIIIFIFGAAPMAAYKIFQQLRSDTELKNISEIEKIQAEVKLREAELKLLKGQLNPHFLFNTLNNLHTLSIQNSEKTPNYIIQISELLNYVIYDSNTEKVPLEKEIEFIRNYIELEKLTHNNESLVDFDISGDFRGWFINPMLMQVFIEHILNIDNSCNQNNPTIKISITINEGKLVFRASSNQARKFFPNNYLIMLENTKKRLRLAYPEHHKIKIDQHEYVLNIELEIKLNEPVFL